MTQIEKISASELEKLSNKLLELIEIQPSDDFVTFESNYVQELAVISSSIHEIMNTSLSEKLTVTSANLASFYSSDEIFSAQEWPDAYKDFVNNEVAEFKNEVREIADKKYAEISEEISYQNQLIDIFVTAVSYPALLPSTLHQQEKGLQTYLVQYLQEYLSEQNLRLYTVPGREKQLTPLINELMPVRLDSSLKALEYYFKLTV